MTEKGDGMGDDGFKMTRRCALALAGAGVACGAGWALSRKGLLRALDEDAEDPNPVQVMRRPFAADPSREISLLGYGGIRLPTRNRSDKDMDLDLGRKLVDYALRHGVNAFDTGWVYHKGEGEKFWGALLPQERRAEYFLSDKMCTWELKSLDDAKKMFQAQLDKCRTPYFDQYFLHSLSDEKQYHRVYHEYGVLKYLEEERARGRIKYLGFSFHGKHDFLKRLVDERKWDFAMIVFNALTYKGENGSKAFYDLLAGAKIPVFVMEPLGGGRLARFNGPAKKILTDAKPDRSAASWSLKFAASFPAIQTLFSGMGRFEHLRENIRSLATDFKPFSKEETDVYWKAVDEYLRYPTVGCTGCRYCLPCPYGVEIPEVFTWWNSFAGAGRIPARKGPNDSQDLRRRFLASYTHAVTPGHGAERCIGCKKCTVPCPQWIFRIPTEMAKIDKVLTEVRADYVAKGGRL